MRKIWASAVVLCLVLLGLELVPAFAGDSLYGKVTVVKSAQVVVFDYGKGLYDLRIIGIDAPSEGPIAQEAKQFVSNLVLGKKVRMRFEYRTKNGEMLSRLLTDDPQTGIKDVGVELVKAGLARRQPKYDYKYGELSAAESDAQKGRRGLWATTQRQ